MENFHFQNTTESDLTFADVAQKIKEFIEDAPQAYYTLTIGSDSEVKSEEKNHKNLEIITAIVIYRRGYGGKYFWSRKKIKTVKSLREKIYQEVLMSIDAAKYLVPELKINLNENSPAYDLEIHIDVGEHGDTREMIREVVGIVTGFGYTARTKPYSYAASNIADRHA
jgi:uncharacterized protein